MVTWFICHFIGYINRFDRLGIDLTTWEREQIFRLEKEIEELKKLVKPLDLHTNAKSRLINAIKRRKKFFSKSEWGRRALISMDTFYRIIEEVQHDLLEQGYRVVYTPIYGRKNKNKAYRILVHLELV